MFGRSLLVGVLHLICSTMCANLFEEAVAASAELNEQWTRLPVAPNTNATSRVTSWSCTLGDKLYFFGGESLDEKELLGDFWYLDLVALTWEKITATGGPSARRKIRMACDEKRNIVYLIAGKKHSDLWAYSPQSNTWREIPSDLVNGLDYDVFSTDFVAMSTTDHIVIAGTSNGEYSDYSVFNKDTETWRPRGYDTRLKVEDPGGVGVGDLAVFTGGVFGGSALPNRTYIFNASDPNGLWEDLVNDGMAGEEFKMVSVGNGTLVLIGDPGGKGFLATGNKIATLDMNAPRPLHWDIVQQTNNASYWVPDISDFNTASYKGKMIAFCGVVTIGGNVSGNADVWVFNPDVCPEGCNGNGRCVRGNCVECTGHSGVTCGISDPTSTDYTNIIIGIVVGGSVSILLLLLLGWKATAKHRAFRRLYDTNAVAENMAEQIARMELDQLNYLLSISNPTRVQASFITIVKTLKTYKMYLPDSVLQATAVKDTDEDVSSRHSCTSSGSKNHTKSSFSSGQTAHSAAAHVAQDLAAKVVKKQVATCTFHLPTYVTWVGEQGGKGNMRRIHEVVAVFADKVHNVVSSLRGTVLDAQLANGRIMCAWNFQIQKASPEVAAADAAVSIEETLTDSFPLKVYTAVTGGPCWAGNLGGSNLRVPAMVGRQHHVTDVLVRASVTKKIAKVTNLEGLADFFKILPCDIITTMKCISKSGISSSVPSDLPGSVWLLEICSRTNGPAQEWMYELEEAQNSANDLFRVMRVYENDGADTARALLGTLVSGFSSEKVQGAKHLMRSLGWES
eukprot:TRINITY_DN3154_c0_g1_i1.p1 TRINITY_DN3154_c0_g1~~TRINITY_DN3154_c0_g1_i1.p1  ORF type:complete len:792 (+),score=250.44 TRINITY_DN3154_c0_g1_i1:94-2469(+)